jgi:hypothetical protein
MSKKTVWQPSPENSTRDRVARMCHQAPSVNSQVVKGPHNGSDLIQCPFPLCYHNRSVPPHLPIPGSTSLCSSPFSDSTEVLGPRCIRLFLLNHSPSKAPAPGITLPAIPPPFPLTAPRGRFKAEPLFPATLLEKKDFELVQGVGAERRRSTAK